jgi:aminomethyltransferase
MFLEFGPRAERLPVPQKVATSAIRPYVGAIVSDSGLKQTPLFQEHEKLGAKMTEFSGWNMPVCYSSIVEEHHAVRNRVGIFDISHMGQIEVSGPAAKPWLNRMLSNNVDRLAISQGQYSLLLNKAGGVIDDLLVYRRHDDQFLLVVNAAKIDEDFAWMLESVSGGVAVLNCSSLFGALAVQGPRSPELMGIFGELPPRNHFCDLKIEGSSTMIARTGYTGEDGFELFFPGGLAPFIWNRLLELGKPLGMVPCGLGSRDTLRLEACFPLNGSDLTPERTPLEAGLGLFVDLTKREFIGREALCAQKESGIKQRLSALKATGKSPPFRSHYPVFAGEGKVGELTSGTQSPTLGVAIGLGYLNVEFAQPRQKVEIEIRGRRYAAGVERKPMYKSLTPRK